MKRYPDLLERLRSHVNTCLRPGKCADARNGGLRLSSTTPNTWPSKVALVLSSAAWLENRSARELAPDAFHQLALWMRNSAKKLTVSDQINSSTGAVIGGSYYPRLITVEALLTPISTNSKPFLPSSQ